MTVTVNQLETAYVEGTPNLSRVVQMETAYVEGTPNLSRVTQMEVVYVMMDPSYLGKQRRPVSLMAGTTGI